MVFFATSSLCILISVHFHVVISNIMSCPYASVGLTLRLKRLALLRKDCPANLGVACL